MNQALQNQELVRLEILRAFKKHLVQDGGNVSPFSSDLVIRYHTKVDDWDIPDIHKDVRDVIEQSISDIRKGQPSQVVILAGNPGMGKSHIINFFRSRELADRLGYVLVGNSNHWKVEEFEECLLDWMLTALVFPSPNNRHILLDKIEDVAFGALNQILQQPGQIRQYRAKGAYGLWRRFWTKLFGSEQARMLQWASERDHRAFQLLDFAKFSGFVCNQYLHDSSNPFHRYALRVLLHYLFEEDRETVLHWLRNKKVSGHFVKKLSAEDEVDRKYKVADIIKILISLFASDVARSLSSGSRHSSDDRLFFFAFDQMEGRQELFESDDDWMEFFAHLSELYNALPNVFILFTMTVNQRNKLHSKMEGQFRDRIKRDQRFLLHEVKNEDILRLYQKRLQYWLGNDLNDIREQLDSPGFSYLPFTQEELLGISRTKTLREALTDFDREFRNKLKEVIAGPYYDYLVARNDYETEENETNSVWDYTEDHLDMVQEFLTQAGQTVARSVNLELAGVHLKEKEGQLPALFLDFRDPKDIGRWVRVFLVRLPFRYNQWIDGCAQWVKHKYTDRYFLWLVRPKLIDASLETLRENQTFPRELPIPWHTSLRALLDVIQKKDEYSDEQWQEAEKLFLDQCKGTYLEEMFQQVSRAMGNLQEEPMPETEPQVLEDV
jgi:hypothetical protein